MKTFRYILRYLIDPGFDADVRISELVGFCVESKIEEVMLFIAAEELSPGHPLPDELAAYAEVGKRLKAALAPHSIAISLNPWSTVYHNFRGRRLREDQDFRRMVGENGNTNPVAVCPLCVQWQSYLCESFSYLAREIEPTTLWIEDDWRLRNHDQDLLGWGGCFCEEHLSRFSLKVGACEVIRTELVKNITAPNDAHPWRKAWLELSCETLVEPLRRLSMAIRSASPTTRVALMSSSPDAHSSEGRDWRVFQKAVGAKPTFITRPNMAPYTQTFALAWPPSLTRHTLANLKGSLEIYPELENSPRCGPYSKSAKYTAWQMANCALIGSHGVTINHFDMLGNGLALDPKFGRGLAMQKGFLNAVLHEGFDDRQSDGVSILFSPNISGHIYCQRPGTLAGLMQESYLWGDACAILGIAHRYTSTIEDDESPVLVSGQTLRAFTDEELHLLFRKAVVLDAESALIALERGFGPSLGVTEANWLSLREDGFSYERIDSAEDHLYGLRYPRMTAQRCSDRLLAISPDNGTELLSTLHRGDHTLLAPGITLFRNSNGGRVICLAYPVERKAQFFMGFFNRFRSIFFQQLLFQVAPKARLAMAAGTPLHCYRYQRENTLWVGLTNPNDDAADSLIILLPTAESAFKHWKILDIEGCWSSVEVEMEQCRGYIRYEVKHSLGHLQTVLLKAEL